MIGTPGDDRETVECTSCGHDCYPVEIEHGACASCRQLAGLYEMVLVTAPTITVRCPCARAGLPEGAESCGLCDLDAVNGVATVPPPPSQCCPRCGGILVSVPCGCDPVPVARRAHRDLFAAMRRMTADELRLFRSEIAAAEARQQG